MESTMVTRHTAEGTARRQALADASTGLAETPTIVALYVNAPDGQDPQSAMRALRAYATARGMTITAALYDVGSSGPPRSQRPALMRVSRLAEEGRIAEIITPAAVHMSATTPTERAALAAWLDDLGVAVRYVEAAEAGS
ncbi:recombinase family protein [Streptomyces sp. cg36]|uniref:recombinase family protein n=1 Tax=Streptomyces sp. cg36 TaxID=3238798 RepID=UPI0034E24176